MLSCYQTRVINAPIEKVWDIVKDFHDLLWAPSIIKSCENIGAKHLLNDAFEETLATKDLS